MQIEADGKIYTLNPSDVLIFAPGTTYQLINPKNSATLLALNFDYTFDSADKSIPIPPDIPDLFCKENITEIVKITNFEYFKRT
jgi:hypothetical protein